MAARFSILTWKIPQTEDPDGLQFMGAQSIGQDRETEHRNARWEITTAAAMKLKDAYSLEGKL